MDAHEGDVGVSSLRYWRALVIPYFPLIVLLLQHLPARLLGRVPRGAGRVPRGRQRDPAVGCCLTALPALSAAEQMGAGGEPSAPSGEARTGKKFSAWRG